jgi:hypothetical protein
MAARLLLLCLRLCSSWLTVEGGRVGTAGVVHRRGGRAAIALSVATDLGVPEWKSCHGGCRVPRLLHVSPMRLSAEERRGDSSHRRQASPEAGEDRPDMPARGHRAIRLSCVLCLLGASRTFRRGLALAGVGPPGVDAGA